LVWYKSSKEDRKLLSEFYVGSRSFSADVLIIHIIIQLQFLKIHLVRNWYTNVIKIYNYVLTPWCGILFEKLIVTQLIKSYSAFFTEPECSSPCSQKPATGH